MINLTEEQKHQEEEYIFPYHYLDLNIDSYKYIWSLPHLNIINKVKEILKPYNGQKILDAGCGDGRLCYELKDENLNITGLDYSEKAIAFAKAFNPKTKFLVQDLHDLNLNKNFDYILFMEVIEHINPKELQKVLEKVSKLLKDQGKLIITVPSTKLPLAPKHYQHFTEESLEETIKPYFKLTKTVWHSNTGRKKMYFNIFKRFALVSYSFRDRFKIVKKLLSFLQKYYQKNIATAQKNKGEGIIAVCEKIK